MAAAEGAAGAPLSETALGRSRSHSTRINEAAASATAYLWTCQALVEAMSAVVAILTAAGSELQRGLAEKPPAAAAATDGRDSDRLPIPVHLAVDEDDATAAAVQGLVGTCGALGVMLIGLASSVSSDVVAPLTKLRQRLQAEQASCRDEFLRLRQHELACSAALTESLQRRDKAHIGLQGALRDRDRKEREKSGKSMSMNLAWMTRQLRSDEEAAASAESKLRRAALAQTAAIEELAERTEEAALARIRAERAEEALTEALQRIRPECAAALETSIGRFAEALDEAAGSLHEAAVRLRCEAAVLGQDALASAATASDAAVTSSLWHRRGEAAMPELTLEPGEDNPSPFVAPPPLPSGRPPPSPSATLPPRRLSLLSSAFSVEAPAGEMPRPRSGSSIAALAAAPEDAVKLQGEEVYGNSRVFSNPFGLDSDEDLPADEGRRGSFKHWASLSTAAQSVGSSPQLASAATRSSPLAVLSRGLAVPSPRAAASVAAVAPVLSLRSPSMPPPMAGGDDSLARRLSSGMLSGGAWFD